MNQTQTDGAALATLLEDTAAAVVMTDGDDREALVALRGYVEKIAELVAGAKRDAALATLATLAAAIDRGEANDALGAVARLLDRVREPEPASAPAAAPGKASRDDETIGMFGDFLQELEVGLDGAEELLLSAERAGCSPEDVNALFRVFHSVKGSAACLEIEDVTSLAHATETLLNLARDGAITLAGAPLERVFEAASMMRRLHASVRQAVEADRPLERDAAVVTLVARIEATLAAPPSPDASPAAPPPPAPSPAPVDAPPEPSADAAANVWLFQPPPVAPVAVAPPIAAPVAVVPPIAAPPSPAPIERRAPRSDDSSARAPEPPNDAAPRDAAEKGAGKLRETLKVDLERVESVVEMIGELIIVESMVVNAPEILGVSSLRVRNYLNQLTKISRDLQNVAMRMRMVPVRGVFQKMARMVRDLSKKTGKDVVLVQSGESAEMDRSMVERIEDPLVHMIRNAVDHGIEAAEERAASGKPSAATIRLSAYHEGGSIVVEIADDGRGLSREAILKKAIARGLVAEGHSLSDAEVHALIFLPGFSTAAQVTEISGRGVGMDVVKRAIEAMRGRVTIASTPGKGTTFRMILPLTLAIIDGMLVSCGAERYIVPSLSIVESFRPTPATLKTLAGAELLDVRGEILPLVRLHRLFRVPGEERPPTQSHAVVVESMGRKIALLVDDVLTQQQVVIKPLGASLAEVEYLSGAAILSDGRVGLILNIDRLGPLTTTYRSGARAQAAREELTP